MTARRTNGTSRSIGRARDIPARARPHRAAAGKTRLRLVDRSAATGSPHVIMVRGAPRAGTDVVAYAARRLRELSGALTSEPEFRPQFITDCRVERTHGGMSVVHFRQVHMGVPIVGMTRAVRIAPNGTVHSIIGDSIAWRSEPAMTPAIEAREAVRRAARALLDHECGRALEPDARKAFEALAAGAALDVERNAPAAGRSFTLRDPRGGATASVSLVLVPQRRRLAIAWEVRLQDRCGENHFALWIAAGAREKTLGVHDHSLGFAARAWVHRLRPQAGSPELVDLPDVQLGLPFTLRAGNAPVTGTWLVGNDTNGRCVEAVVYEVANDHSTLVAAVANGADLLFDERADERRLAAVQLLYFCSWLHDFFERLGFGPLAGNLERDGTGGDPLLARVRDVPNLRHAWLVPAPDGNQCVLFTGPDPDTGRLNALDADTVFHEYTHAVTQRLVGGPGNVDVLREPQSSGLAEGWSDYFALSIQSARAGTDKTTIGEWTSRKSGGERSRPYDADFSNHVRFASLGAADRRTPHEVGEVWAALLLQTQRELAAVFPASTAWAYALLWQVVFDSLPSLPPNPTFLHARDAMLTALGAMNGKDLTQVQFDQARGAMWRAFATFGLGTDARCKDTGFKGIVESTVTPP